MALQYGEGGDLEVTLEGPYASLGGGGAAAKLTTIHMPVSGWKGAESPYSQVVQVEEVSVNSVIFLQASVEQMEELRDLNTEFTTENDAGVVTAYATGDKPTEDYTFQAIIMEVVA